MGQYAHGNQPIQHAIYLYNWLEQPWKTQMHAIEIMDKLYSCILLFICINIYYVNAQCANTANIYRFDFNGHTYEVVKENKSWTEAVACAVARGGYLAEINTAAENTAIFDELLNNANITLSLTSTNNG